MSGENNFQFPVLYKTNLIDIIDALKFNLFENEKKMENILRDETCYENCLLENQINKCFGIVCQLEDCQQKLKDLESKTPCSETPTTLMDFISNIPIVENNRRPEALIVVISEEAKEIYEEIMRRLSMKKVLITTISALTKGDVRVPLGNVKTALLDGSEAAYAQFLGGESVRLVISDLLPSDRLFYVWSDKHRDECFKHIFQRECVQ